MRDAPAAAGGLRASVPKNARGRSGGVGHPSLRRPGRNARSSPLPHSSSGTFRLKTEVPSAHSARYGGSLRIVKGGVPGEPDERTRVAAGRRVLQIGFTRPVRSAVPKEMPDSRTIQERGRCRYRSRAWSADVRRTRGMPARTKFCAYMPMSQAPSAARRAESAWTKEGDTGPTNTCSAAATLLHPVRALDDNHSVVARGQGLRTLKIDAFAAVSSGLWGGASLPHQPGAVRDAANCRRAGCMHEGSRRCTSFP